MESMEMESSAELPSGWSSLPDDLLRDIVARLGTIVDVLAFRAVCPWWRAAAEPHRDALAAAVPLLVVELKPHGETALFDFADRRYLRSRLPSRPKIYTIPCSYGFLVVTSPAPAIYNVLTGEQTELPAVLRPMQMFRRAILSGFPSSPGCIAVLLADTSFLWCRVGDSSWTEQVLDGINIWDMIFLGEQLYAVLFEMHDMKIAAIDLLLAVQLRYYHASPGTVWKHHWGRRKFCWILSHLRGELLLVFYDSEALKVLHFDFGSQGVPKYKHNLGGAALFLSSSSFVACVVAPPADSSARGDFIYSVADYPNAWMEIPLHDARRSLGLMANRKRKKYFEIAQPPLRGGQFHRSISWVLPQACLPAN